MTLKAIECYIAFNNRQNTRVLKVFNGVYESF